MEKLHNLDFPLATEHWLQVNAKKPDELLSIGMNPNVAMVHRESAWTLLAKLGTPTSSDTISLTSHAGEGRP